RFTTEAKEKEQAISTPQIGEVVTLGQEPTTDWWADLD
ncbi:MAG: hypothetical protein ACI82Q_000994, partial [Nonlabens sp.]